MSAPDREIAPAGHDGEHAGAARRALLQPPASDLIRVGSRRWFLQTGLAGLASLSLPDLLRCRAQRPAAGGKAVILIWLSGGPSVSAYKTCNEFGEAGVENRADFSEIFIAGFVSNDTSQMDTFDLKPGHANGGPFNTALSLQHGAKICDAFSVIPFASGLLQEPVADAAMHFRQWQAPTVGPRGKKAGACARAGGLAAYVATPA